MGQPNYLVRDHKENMIKNLHFTQLFNKFDCSRIREQSNLLNMDKAMINKAIQQVREATGFKAEWKENGELTLITDQHNHTWSTEVRKGLRNAHISMLMQVSKGEYPLMIITDYLLPNLREAFRKQGIGYIDTAGNIYFRVQGQMVFIDGKQPDKRIKRNQVKNRGFTKTGLPLIFDLMQNDDWLTKTHREFAALYQMSLGNVHNIFKNLQDEDFLLQTGNIRSRQYHFLNKKELMEEWIIGYEEKLKPIIYIDTFRFLKEGQEDDWKNIPLKAGKTFFGGEPAGDLLTNYLKPAILTLYTTEERKDLIKNYRLVPDPSGNIVVYSKFWHYGENNKTNTVPPLLVYTDLMNTGDARCIETAQKIYDGLLKNKF